jgi:hypothetical protein
MRTQRNAAASQDHPWVSQYSSLWLMLLPRILLMKSLAKATRRLGWRVLGDTSDVVNMVMSNMEYEADIIDASTPNLEYKVGIQVYQGREPNMNKKHKTRDVKDDISDAVVPKHGTQVGHQGLLRKSLQESRVKGWNAQGQPQGQVRQDQERDHRDEQRGRPYR